MQSDRNELEDKEIGIYLLEPCDGKKHLMATTKEDKAKLKKKTKCRSMPHT